MVGMECFAGLAAPAAGGAQATFNYNRENFLFDRKCRMRKEFQLRSFRVEQASQWRDDVRDLISLTEYKMHVYLLVNVLLLGFTVALWCEGRLPSTTPNWLMMGSAISITGAFMFLLLSIWLAMHAAIAAQSYETRLLTQMVRLPLPTWHELEACRTTASDFERTEPKQMFRVPFLMGRQERLARRQAAEAAAASAAAPAAATAGASGAAAPPGPVPTADPWGLERCGDDVAELGCHEGSEVAKLRHIKLARQAMVYWQTYDAFARISMSIGVIELLLAMSYYVLGYVLVQDGCRSAATYGVILLTSMSVSITKMDMTLSVWESRRVQMLLFFCPSMSCVASYHWSHQSSFDLRVAEMLIVIAFFSHGFFLGLMTVYSRITPQDNGTLLPVAFRSVLYLDVFGWLRSSVENPPSARRSRSGRLSRATTRARSSWQLAPRSQLVPRTIDEERCEDDDRAALGELDDDDPLRPSMETLRYTSDGVPLPLRPEDLAPKGAAEDMRGVVGAPHGSFQDHLQSKSFFKAKYWMPGSVEHGEEEDSDADDRAATGHDSDNPGIIPWRVFSTVMICLCAAWLAAGFYHGLVVLDLIEHADEIKYVMEGGPSDEPWERKVPMPREGTFLSLKRWGFRIRTPFSTSVDDRVEHFQTSWPSQNIRPMSLACDAAGSRFAVTDRFRTFTGTIPGAATAAAAPAGPGLVALIAEKVIGSGISRRARGEGRLVPDDSAASFRASAPTAQLESAGSRPRRRSPPPAVGFEELTCLSLLGEGLQDVAVTCADGDQGSPECQALVLHRHGRRVTACPMSEAAALASLLQRGGGGSAQGSLIANVSDAWLEVLRRERPGASDTRVALALATEDNAGLAAAELAKPHAHFEKTVAFSIDHACWGADAAGQAGCLGGASAGVAFAATSQGRVVQLGQHSRWAELVPTEVLDEGVHGGSSLGPGAVRTLGGRYVGILRQEGEVIQVLDLHRGGTHVGKIRLPEGQPAAAFCAGGDHLFLLGKGSSPQLSRVPLPHELLKTAI